LARSAQKKKGGAEVTLLAQESGTWLKKWTGRLPVALIYPNSYTIGVSSLGFQLVYSLCNEIDTVVCERFFLPEKNQPLRSFESDRPLRDFPLVLYSISFEHDYVNLARILLAAGIPLFAEQRDNTLICPDNPLVIGGGVATFLNPEPLAPFTDMFLLGEAEGMIRSLFSFFDQHLKRLNRLELLLFLQKHQPGTYVPAFYKPVYNDQQGRQIAHLSAADLPSRITKVTVATAVKSAHSQLLSPRAEFANLYITELGRGCSMGCRFCAAGFIYRPPRLWDADAVIKGLAERGEDVNRIGLLGMEMANENELESISSYLLESGCSLSFSSLRADRISGTLLKLLGSSGLKSVAIAPDGASERLRRVINKNLTEDDILLAAERLVEAGVYNLKLYFMIGLPCETFDDLQEMVNLVKKVKEKMMPHGKARGRLCKMTLSVNCFAPKPWTPFQYHPFAGLKLVPGTAGKAKDSLKSLKEKLKFLKEGLRSEANIRINHDKPDQVLFQAVLARGDRRLAPVIADMANAGMPWKQAMRRYHLTAEFYAVHQYDENEYFPWNIVDNGIEQSYLWHEYQKSFLAKTTVACEPAACKRCGVCGD